MKILKNKNVIIVGPSSYLQNMSMGEYIDSFDLVVRINDIHDTSNESLTKDFGKRTDIIYFDGSMPQSRLERYVSVGPKLLICTYPENEWFFSERCSDSIKRVENIIETEIVDQDLYLKLKSNLDSNLKVRPNSGLVGIVDLLNRDIKNLYVTGIDFYRNSYASWQPDFGSCSLNEIKQLFKNGDNGDVHDINRQFKYFKNVFNKDSRLNTDDIMYKYMID